jgi:hypothetical protein
MLCGRRLGLGWVRGQSLGLGSNAFGVSYIYVWHGRILGSNGMVLIQFKILGNWDWNRETSWEKLVTEVPGFDYRFWGF